MSTETEEIHASKELERTTTTVVGEASLRKLISGYIFADYPALMVPPRGCGADQIRVRR